MTVGEVIDALDVKKFVEVRLGAHGPVFELGYANTDWDYIRQMTVKALSKRIARVRVMASFFYGGFPDTDKYFGTHTVAMLTIIAEEPI